MPRSKKQLPPVKTVEPVEPDKSTISLANELAKELAAVVKDKLGVENFSPFEILALIAANELNDVNVRLKAASNLALYYRPQVRAVAIESHKIEEHHIIFDE
jgi:hypothetical protein